MKKVNVADMDDDAIVAVADLAGRTGATEFKIGYLHEDVPADQAGWYAQTQYQGARIVVGDQPGPVEAADALSRRLLSGGALCRCNKIVTLGNGRDPRKYCKWTREGAKWLGTCGAGR